MPVDAKIDDVLANIANDVEKDKVSRATAPYPKDGVDDLIFVSQLSKPGKDNEPEAKQNIEKLISSREVIVTALITAWKAAQPNGAGVGAGPVVGQSRAISEVVNALPSPWTDADKKPVVDAFKAKNYETIASLGERDSVPDKVDSALSAAKIALPADKLLQLKSALQAAVATPTTVAGPVAAGTSVPSGAVNLESGGWPTLKAEKEGTFTQFDIPSAFLVVSAGMTWDKLDRSQLIGIARRLHVTRAWNLNKILADDPVPYAAYSPLLWKTDHTNGITGESVSLIEAYVSSTVSEKNAHSHLLADASAAANYGYCKGSVQASYELTQGNKEYGKRVTAVARYRKSQFWIDIRNATKLSPVFEYLVNVALTKVEADQFDFLSELFDKFGHVTPSLLLIGAQLEIERELVSIEQQSSADTKSSAKAAGEIRAGVAESDPGLNVNVGFSIEDGTLSNKGDCYSKLQFLSRGGAGAMDPKTWWTQADDPGKWDVLESKGTLPLTEWLMPDQKNKVQGIVEARSKLAWTSPLCKGAAFELPDTILPYFPMDHLLTIRSMFKTIADAVDLITNDRVYDWKQHGSYLEAFNSINDAPDGGAFDDESKDVNGAVVDPSSNLRIRGPRYTWCQRAPLQADLAQGDSPTNNRLLWKLMYTGETTKPELEPLYWIVTADEEWLLAAFEIPNYNDFACLYPFKEAMNNLTTSTRLRWTITVAIPPGRGQTPELVARKAMPGKPQVSPRQTSNWFRLWNEGANKYLGDWAEFSAYQGRQFRVHKDGYYQALGPPTGGQVWVPPSDFVDQFDHDNFNRTALRTGVDLTSVFGTNYSLAKEQNQRANYFSTCWLIEDFTSKDPPPSATFAELEDNYIESLMAAYEAGTPLDLVKVQAGT